jgi:hypothetical protein
MRSAGILVSVLVFGICGVSAQPLTAKGGLVWTRQIANPGDPPPPPNPEIGDESITADFTWTAIEGWSATNLDMFCVHQTSKQLFIITSAIAAAKANSGNGKLTREKLPKGKFDVFGRLRVKDNTAGTVQWLAATPSAFAIAEVKQSARQLVPNGASMVYSNVNPNPDPTKNKLKVLFDVNVVTDPAGWQIVPGPKSLGAMAVPPLGGVMYVEETAANTPVFNQGVTFGSVLDGTYSVIGTVSLEFKPTGGGAQGQFMTSGWKNNVVVPK